MDNIIKSRFEKFINSQGIVSREDFEALIDRHEKLNYKIREFSLQKIPFIGVVGEKEVTNNTLNIRELGSEKQYSIQIDEFIKKIKNSCRIS